VIGSEAHRHLSRLGVPEDKMESAPYCVDTDFFSGEVSRWAPQREEIRREFGIGPSDVALVFSGKLIPKKDPLLLPASLRLLEPRELERVHLLVVGDGDLRDKMEHACREVNCARVRCFGFLNQSEIGRIYAAGDALVLPSRRGMGETWGLAVNEAMQFGLPAIVSDGVGCHRELIHPGKTGFVFDSAVSESLASGIRWYLGLSASARELAATACRSAIEKYTVQLAVDGLRSAVFAVIR
jgi:glycosyltransferase involved in cell wall biosynthesis